MKKIIFKQLVALLAFLIPFCVYIFTLSPSISAGDSTEMVTAAVVLGVPHQPSYPVNTLLGHIAYELPLPLNPIERINAVSALLQALSVLVFYFLVLDLFRLADSDSRRLPDSGLDKDPETGYYLVAFTAGMFLAFNTVFWQYATKFEVFPLNNFFVVSILFITVRICRKFKSAPTISFLSSLKMLLILAVLSGFAFSHHETAVLVFPAVFFLLLTTPVVNIFKSPSRAALIIPAFLVGILPYVFLLIFIASKNPPLNWGGIKTIPDAISALTRQDFGTFSAYLAGSDTSGAPSVFEEAWFYLKYIVLDFSIIGAIFAVAGIFYLWKEGRGRPLAFHRILIFISTGFFVSGFLFLAYADFPLGDDFSQATAARFFMLPNIFVTLFIAFGLLMIYKLFNELPRSKAGEVSPRAGSSVIDSSSLQADGVFSIKNKILSGSADQRFGLAIGKVLLITSFVTPFLINFDRANGRAGTATIDYTQAAYAGLPDNALVLQSGDIAGMTMDYFRYVQQKGKDHMVTFSPGQFHLAWFIPQLKARYPDLVIPTPKPGKVFTSTTQLVNANYGRRPIYVNPDLVVHDPELEQKYTLWPKNMLFLVLKSGKSLKLEDYRAENDKLWNSLDLASFARIKRDAPLFEGLIIFYYSRHFYNLGYVFEQVKLYDDAITQYKRVLQIDPYFKEALAGLGRIYGYEKKPPDYASAINYLQDYLSVLGSGDGELAQEAQSMISDLQDKSSKQTGETAAQTDNLASPSAAVEKTAK